MGAQREMAYQQCGLEQRCIRQSCRFLCAMCDELWCVMVCMWCACVSVYVCECVSREAVKIDFLIVDVWSCCLILLFCGAVCKLCAMGMNWILVSSESNEDERCQRRTNVGNINNMFSVAKQWQQAAAVSWPVTQHRVLLKWVVVYLRCYRCSPTSLPTASYLKQASKLAGRGKSDIKKFATSPTIAARQWVRGRSSENSHEGISKFLIFIIFQSSSRTTIEFKGRLVRSNNRYLNGNVEY